MYKNSGDIIRIWRAEFGFSQKELAEKMFIEQPTLSNYENGKTQVPIDVRIKIAQHFNKDIREIFPEILNSINFAETTLGSSGNTNFDTTIFNAVKELTTEVKALLERINTSI